jgi:hypothetical protein
MRCMTWLHNVLSNCWQGLPYGTERPSRRAVDMLLANATTAMGAGTPERM